MPVRADSRIVIEQAGVNLEPVPSRIHIGRGHVRTAATAEADAVWRRRFQDWRFIAQNQLLSLHNSEVLWSDGNSRRECRACCLPAAIAVTQLEQGEYAGHLEPHSTAEAGSLDHDSTSLARSAHRPEFVDRFGLRSQVTRSRGQVMGTSTLVSARNSIRVPENYRLETDVTCG